jgi:ribosomal protein S18 acetylase RimI-like enzyme
MSGQARIAERDDAETLGRLLHDFNCEYNDPTPGPVVLAERIDRLIADEQALFLLIGEPAVGVVALRFRPSIVESKDDCYLEEFYVAPHARGQGLGRDLLQEAIRAARERGAGRMELGTAETDEAARHVYETSGFSNLEDGAPMLFYELDL